MNRFRPTEWEDISRHLCFLNTEILTYDCPLPRNPMTTSLTSQMPCESSTVPYRGIR